MHDPGLSPKQIEVINAISNGVTITGAAAQTGVHRKRSPSGGAICPISSAPSPTPNMSARFTIAKSAKL
jgi:hypothetical protein